MPSKIPQEAEIDSDDGEEMMPMGAGYPGMPERKEYLWSCDLKGNFKTHPTLPFRKIPDYRADNALAGVKCAELIHFRRKEHIQI